MVGFEPTTPKKKHGPADDAICKVLVGYQSV